MLPSVCKGEAGDQHHEGLRMANGCSITGIDSMESVLSIIADNK